MSSRILTKKTLKNGVYTVKVKLEATYTFNEYEVEDDYTAKELAKGYLLTRIEKNNVCYDDLKASIVNGYKSDGLHTVVNGKMVSK
jgi:hypothetical protein